MRWRRGCERLGKELGGKVEASVQTGIAWEEISELATSKRTDLIVIATHGWTGLRHIVVGSTAERVVRHAPCAVLVVPSYRREFAK
jgi:universal stress protein A